MPRPPPVPIHRLAAQIGVVRHLALEGQTGPAKRLCGLLFLDHLPVLARERALLEAIVECCLLLEMAALLARLLRAVFGVGVEAVKLGGAGSRHWTLRFSNGISLLVPAAGPLREASGAGGPGGVWARRVLAVAEAEMDVAGPVVRRVREGVLSIV